MICTRGYQFEEEQLNFHVILFVLRTYQIGIYSKITVETLEQYVKSVWSYQKDTSTTLITPFWGVYC